MKKSRIHVPISRRGFIGRSAAAGGYLLMQGMVTGATVTDIATGTGGFGGNAVNSPLIVVTEPLPVDIDPRAVTWPYITEILHHAGLFFEMITPARLSTLVDRPDPVLILAGDLPLSIEQQGILSGLVERGGSLIGIGGTSGMEKLFGVEAQHPLAEGWINITAADHAITQGLRSSLHVFGGNAVTPATASSLATVDTGRQGPQGSTIVEHSYGKGHTVLLAPDLIFSIVHIQQGIPVLQDGKPSPDGTAPLNDGELKAEDGCVLDWQRDRTRMQPDGEPAFLEPITDELREIIVRSILYLASQQHIALPVLWYWPRDLKAIGHISHDSDGNEPARAPDMLDVLNSCHIKSTWCILYPGGYPKDFYRTLKQQGFEIALHYDARSGGAQTSWSKDNFMLQYNWLKAEAEMDKIVTNKNHYTRWENRLDCFRWCEEAGIHADQTRGPSKKGTIGFPLGGSHPYFPIDDESGNPHMMKVLETNLITQDLVVVCPPEYGSQFVDSVLRHHGVAHFLFHPAHIKKPHVADALHNLVQYGRDQGLEWWTSEEIYRWELSRRNAKVNYDSANSFTIHTGTPLHEATLLFLKPPDEIATETPDALNTASKSNTASNTETHLRTQTGSQTGSPAGSHEGSHAGSQTGSQTGSHAIQMNGQPVSAKTERIYGFEFDVVTTDLEGEVTFQAVPTSKMMGLFN